MRSAFAQEELLVFKSKLRRGKLFTVLLQTEQRPLYRQEVVLPATVTMTTCSKFRLLKTEPRNVSIKPLA